MPYGDYSDSASILYINKIFDMQESLEEDTIKILLYITFIIRMKCKIVPMFKALNHIWYRLKLKITLSCF